MRHPQKTELESSSFHLMTALESHRITERPFHNVLILPLIYNPQTNIELPLDPLKSRKLEYIRGQKW